MSARGAACTVAFVFLLTGSAAKVRALPPHLLPYKHVRPGMKGIGKTVFHDQEVETFEIEVTGKLDGIGPGQNLILARLAGPILAKTGVMEGMSGSPVYVDGKMIGAVAFSWSFASEPIAGITPIEEMLAAPEARPRARPLARVADPSALETASVRRRVSRRPAVGALRGPLAELGSPSATAARFDASLSSLLGGSGPNSVAARGILPVAVSGIASAWLERWFPRSSGAMRLQAGGLTAGAATAAGSSTAGGGARLE